MLRLWRTRNPMTFREKVRYKMLRDRRSLIVTFADKAAVRDHVAAVIGEQYLPRAYAIIEDPQSLLDLDWPDAYVVKPTHGSGAAIVVSAAASADARLPEARWGWVYRHVRPEFANPHDLAAIAAGWLAKLYGQARIASGSTDRCRAESSSRSSWSVPTAASRTTTSSSSSMGDATSSRSTADASAVARRTSSDPTGAASR